ncbi:MAG TPA: sigma-70 family RNA polymerase sigma factor [Vicinamibacterales bacterium]|nr:sigma-70 family RNA polymerase sigma factor [Vicinamibacterales bacterium]
MKSPVKTDEELMSVARGGARDAFDELFVRYRTAVWAFFRRRVPDARVAEELAQDTFVALLEAAPRYQPTAPFRSYLFAVAYNILLADRRRSLHEPDTLASDVRGDAPEPENAVWIRSALARLDPGDREILMLREYDGLSYQEIADVRGVPLNTVRSQLFRARMALKASLDAYPARVPEGVGHALR